MTIDRLLKRHFWAINVTLVAVAAFFVAEGIMQVVSVLLAPDAKQLSAAPLTARIAPTRGSASPHATSAESILARNPFDSIKGPLDALPPADRTAEPDPRDPYSAPECDGLEVLIITASTNPAWSFAALETSQEKGKSFLRRRGDEIGGKTVEYIGWDRVWLTGARRLCQAPLFKSPEAGAPAHTAPAMAPGGDASPPSDDSRKGIHKVGASEFDVDRGLVDKILENQAELMQHAHIVPEQENGKVVGIRLFGVRPDTLLGALGVENGDRLERINGFDMTSPEKALEAYARLRTSDHLTVSVDRRGKGVDLEYSIR